MLNIPLYPILFAYFAFLLFFGVFIIINFAHLIHTGTLTGFSFIMTLFFLAFSAVIIWCTWYLLQNVNWQISLFSWNLSSGTGLNSALNSGL